MKKYSTTDRLKELMQERNLRQIDIIKKCENFSDEMGIKLNKSDLSQYLSGKVQPNQDKLLLLGRALDVNEVWLMGYTDVPKDRTYTKNQLKVKQIPIIGKVACGKPIFAEENIIGYTNIDDNEKVDFALIAKGDSMNNIKIDDGDLVYIRQQPYVDTGDIALVLVDDEATIKRFYDYPDKVILKPDSKNPKHKPLEYNKKDYQIKIQGKVIFAKVVIR